MNRIIAAIAATLLAVLTLGACSSDADVASENISKAADNFEVQRRIVFYNGITESYILVVEGRCSLGNYDSATRLSVTCKVAEGDGADAYKKHYLGLSDNVTFFAEQLDPISVSAYHYRVVFKPQSIVPDVDVRGDTSDGPADQ